MEEGAKGGSWRCPGVRTSLDRRGASQHGVGHVAPEAEVSLALEGQDNLAPAEKPRAQGGDVPCLC